MSLDNPLTDSQAQSSATFLARIRRFYLLEPLEERVLIFCRYTATAVYNLYFHPVGDFVHLHSDGGTFGRELDGVGDKVDQNLNETVAVSID